MRGLRERALIRTLREVARSVQVSVDERAEIPFGQCLSDTAIATPFGEGCGRNFFASGGPFPNVEKKIDSNDSRMQQVYFSRGKLWSALDTAVTVGGEKRAGIAWFIVNPRKGTIENQGVVAVAGTGRLCEHWLLLRRHTREPGQLVHAHQQSEDRRLDRFLA